MSEQLYNLPDLSGRNAVITGASRGIGAAVAKAYAKAGAHVILVARTIGALEEIDDQITAAGGSATLIPQDIADFEKIEMLGAALLERFGKIDILVANAGMLGTLAPTPHISPVEWAKVMDVNVNANYHLIRTLHPLLLASDAGRAIFVTSGMADICEAYWSAYAASKAALSAMVKVYAAENENSNLRVNLVSPGLVETKMLREAYPGGFDGPVRTPEDTVQTFLDLASTDCNAHGELHLVSDKLAA